MLSDVVTSSQCTEGIFLCAVLMPADELLLRSAMLLVVNTRLQGGIWPQSASLPWRRSTSFGGCAREGGG